MSSYKSLHLTLQPPSFLSCLPLASYHSTVSQPFFQTRCSLKLPIDTELLRESYPLFRRLFLNNFLALFSPPLLSLLFYQFCFCGFLHPRKDSRSHQLLYLIHDTRYHVYERETDGGEKPERSHKEECGLTKAFCFSCRFLKLPSFFFSVFPSPFSMCALALATFSARKESLSDVMEDINESKSFCHVESNRRFEQVQEGEDV